MALPLSGSGNSWPVQIAGRPQLPMSEQPQVQGNLITPGYLRTMRIPLVRGRDFTDADRQGAPAVVLVSEAMAKRLWPGEDPIGQRLSTAFFPDATREVVGIVRDVREHELAAAGTASMYLPLAQVAVAHRRDRRAHAAGRTRGARLVAGRGSARHRSGPADRFRDADGDGGHALDVDRQFTMYLLAAFAAFALVLAAVGLYSVLAYGVASACARSASAWRSAQGRGASCGWSSRTRCALPSSASWSGSRRRSRSAA